MGRAHLAYGVTKIRGRAINPQQPWEDPDDGCPGGWYRSRFVGSVLPYLRPSGGMGGRTSNPLLDRCDDEFLLQCVLYLEEQQDACDASRHEG